jgi:uncharacterized protein (TIGR02001 family)
VRGDRETARPHKGCAAWLTVLVLAAARCMAADGWGGSLDFSSDYLVRGISRTDHDPALQVELHYLNSSGLIAGAFASNSQFERRDARDVELSAFLGYAWHPVEDWSGRFLYSHYAYPWNRHGGKYDYDEIDAVLSYRGWLQFSLNYSPNTPRYLMWPIDALKGESERSVELNLQRPVAKHLGVIGGVGAPGPPTASVRCRLPCCLSTPHPRLRPCSTMRRRSDGCWEPLSGASSALIATSSLWIGTYL